MEATLARRAKSLSRRRHIPRDLTFDSQPVSQRHWFKVMLASAQQVPELDPLPGIFFDIRPDPVQI